jgi:hypothetical protein
MTGKFLFMLVIETGSKKNVFGVSNKKKPDYVQIQEWLKEFKAPILDYKYVGRYNGEDVGLPVDEHTPALPDIFMFGGLYRAYNHVNCIECAFYNSTNGCGVKEYKGKGRSHCLGTYGYKKI